MRVKPGKPRNSMNCALQNKRAPKIGSAMLFNQVNLKEVKNKIEGKEEGNEEKFSQPIHVPEDVS